MISLGRSLFSQIEEDPYSIHSYNFINYDNNIFHFSDPINYPTLFEKYKNILAKGTGQLKILHLGGSHIQADIYSNRMRQRLAEFSNNNVGGRGYVFPYNIAKTNNPWNYEVSFTGEWESCRNVETKRDCDLGLSGITVWSTDKTASFQIKTRDFHQVHYDFNRIKILHKTDSTSFHLNINYPPPSSQISSIQYDGYTEIMYNDFVILGPKNDPANVKDTAGAVKAFKAIAENEATFVSRGDNSGTHKQELDIWAEEEIEPRGEWYQEVGQGMGSSITMANQKEGYILSDRGTYIAFRDKINLEIVSEEDELFHNLYGVIAVNPDRHSHVNSAGAQDFIDYLASETAQKIIRDYKVDGERLFTPLQL